MSRRFTALLLVSGTLAAVAPSTIHPARAGGFSLFAKKDPCAQPPQAITESERQRLHAAVGASVQAINVDAQASGGSDREASYRVVGFTPEGFEGARLRYEMCEQRANGVITAEQYDKFLASNGLVSAASTPTAAGEPAEAVGESAGASGLVGAWTVTSSFVRSTCPPPGDTFGVDALDWLVSAGPDGAYRVEVRGSTFTNLGGAATTGNIALVGTSPVQKIGGVSYTNQTTYVVDVDGDALHGQRVVALLLAGAADGPATACSVFFDVVGKRR